MPASRLLCLLLLAFGLAGCGGGSDQSAGTTATTEPAATTAAPVKGGCRTVQPPPAKPNGGQRKPTQKLDPSKTYRIAFQTNCGPFTIEIDQDSAPSTGASFVALARKGFFDHTVFHRIVPGFVIQGGDPTGTGSGGPGYSTVDPPKAGARYLKYVVAMAKTSAEPPGTSGSQFFVVTGEDAGLPPDYAIIGKVVSGQKTVDRIGLLGDASEQPTQTVEIERARVRVS